VLCRLRRRLDFNLLHRQIWVHVRHSTNRVRQRLHRTNSRCIIVSQCLECADENLICAVLERWLLRLRETDSGFVL